LASFSWHLPWSLEPRSFEHLCSFRLFLKFFTHSLPASGLAGTAKREALATRQFCKKEKMSVKRNSAAAFRLGVTRRGLILLLFSALVVFAMSSVRVAAEVKAQLTAEEEEKLSQTIFRPKVETPVSSIHLFHSKPFILNHILLSHISF
jgi:hypothetical protein